MKNVGGLHVAFACRDTCDVDGKHLHYEASIPMSKAISHDVLLAYAVLGLEDDDAPAITSRGMDRLKELLADRRLATRPS